MNANTFELLLAVVSFDINTAPSFVMLSILKSYFNCLSLITSPVIIHSRIWGKSLTFSPLSHLHHLPRPKKIKLFSLTRDFVSHWCYDNCQVSQEFCWYLRKFSLKFMSLMNEEEVFRDCFYAFSSDNCHIMLTRKNKHELSNTLYITECTDYKLVLRWVSGKNLRLFNNYIVINSAQLLLWLCPIWFPISYYKDNDA